MKLIIVILGQVLLFLLVAGLSGSVDIDVLHQRFRSKRSVVFGLCCQFIVLPFLGFSSAKAFDVEPVYGIMLITVTSSPGGAFSNWWCSVCNADLALSIAMTTCSTILSCGLTPGNLLLYTYLAYGDGHRFDFLRLVQPVLVAAVAIVCGLTLSWRFPTRRWIFNIVGNVCGVLLVVLNLFVSSSGDRGGRSEPVWDKEPKFYACVALPCFCSVVLSLSLAKASRRIPAPQAVAICVEVAYQNTGLAMAIALSSFEEGAAAKATAVPLCYMAMQMLVVPFFLLVAWKLDMTYAKSNESIWRVIFMNHQPDPNEVHNGNSVVPMSPASSTSAASCCYGANRKTNDQANDAEDADKKPENLENQH